MAILYNCKHTRCISAVVFNKKELHFVLKPAAMKSVIYGLQIGTRHSTRFLLLAKRIAAMRKIELFEVKVAA